VAAARRYLRPEERELNLPAEIYSTEAVRRIDRRAIDGAGIDGYTLMNRAAGAALEAARAAFPAARRWQVVCGGGNNGGDGYVLARLAAAKGIEAAVTALVSPERLRGDAATAHRDFVAAGGDVREWSGQLDPAATLVVDAVLGSGLERNVEGRFAEAVAAINAHPAPTLALDIPSGISGDTGAVLGTAVRADLTVTFVGLKQGLFLGQGPDFTGDLVYAGLDIPADCRAAEAPALRRIDEAALRRLLPPRRRSAHKGDFGHLLIVGGGPGMAGAARLAAEAALRCGAGKVSVASAPASCGVVVGGCPEAMCHGVERPADLAPLIERATVLAVGPGLGTGDWSRALFEAALAAKRPVLVDADGLNLLATEPARRDDWILTPHPGEAGRLLGCSAAAVQSDRLAAVNELRRRYGGVAVLKGAGSLVSWQDGPEWICTAGNPGMAAPGMGDVLTGVIGALLAQGLTLEQAAAAGVELHARAGDAAAGSAPRGLFASDLMPALRVCVNL
jgi:ADP-dependent NAD(P)H-hydrate dehydratase / NAD(P)H-hydrate epimerase